MVVGQLDKISHAVEK